MFVFNKVAKLGSARQVVAWPPDQGLDLTARYTNGDAVWRRPTCATILQMIANPIYGGAYACGKSRSVPDTMAIWNSMQDAFMNGWPDPGCT
ncbi:recombinase family protein [Ciceribacter azotifigens]|uniref:recombinase family protein n=1 Tax=Ciceribacter azotifigens TaxID=2069303 RepID=UPI003A85827C